MVRNLINRPDDLLIRPDDLLICPDDLINRPDDLLNYAPCPLGGSVILCKIYGVVVFLVVNL